MKLSSCFGLVLVLGLAACGAKKDKAGDLAAGSAAVVVAGSAAMAGSGSAMAAGSAEGSAMAAGSGSAAAMAGSGAGSGSATAMAGSGAGSGSASDMDMAFDKLSHDDKVKLMKEHVTPDMKKAFQNFDPKKYAGFNCKTCHGKDPAKVKFKMPNPELPKLDFEALKAGKQAPKAAKFMGEVVKPQMAKILGATEWSETNPKGFGCLSCHEQKK